MSVFNDIQVDVKISSTAISGAVTYDITLHGADNGLRELSASVTAAFEEIEGAYTGIAQQGNLKRRRGQAAANVLLNAAMKAFLGKEEQYAYFRERTYEDNGTTLVTTRTWTMRLTRCEPIFRVNALNRIAIEGVVTALAVA